MPRSAEVTGKPARMSAGALQRNVRSLGITLAERLGGPAAGGLCPKDD